MRTLFSLAAALVLAAPLAAGVHSMMTFRWSASLLLSHVAVAPRFRTSGNFLCQVWISSASADFLEVAPSPPMMRFALTLPRPFTQVLALHSSDRQRGSAHTLEIGDLQINVAGEQARWHGKLIPLRPNEFRVLRFMAENPNRVLSRQGSDGSFGLCEDCGQAIPDERLEALPQTRRCRDCQGTREARRRVDR